MPRWLWAPRALISFEHGHSVVTGTSTSTTKSLWVPAQASKPQT